MKVYGILEGIVESAFRLGDPGMRGVNVCERGFCTYDEAAESLIATGWKNNFPPYLEMALGSGAWLRPGDEEREKDEDGYEVERVRYIFEMEVDDAVS